MQNKIDFTNCRKVLGKAYNGANGKKIAVEYDGTEYMLKFPPSGENKPTELSYTNSCISEYIASHIFNMLGVTAHETLLGTYSVSGKEKLVCACKDFTSGGKQLLDFCSVKNTVIDSESVSNGTGTELDDVLETIDKQEFINPKEIKERFWDMFVVDAFVGNFDRHNGNWGFLYDPQTKRTELAPVYDCGSCLLPQADEIVMEKVLNIQEEMDARIYHFPSSILKKDGKKIKYFDFMTKSTDEDFAAAVNRIVPRINIEKISEFINEVPYITELQKEFYKKYIAARNEKIIQPAFEHIQSMLQNEEIKMNM